MFYNRLGFIGLSLIIVVLFCAFAKQSSENRPVDPLLKDVTGEELRQVIESLKGEKVVLVNVWATWCAPCIEEFPEIIKIQRKYKDQLQVIFVSADFPDSRDKALDFLKKQNVDWTTYFKAGKDQQFIEAISKDWTGALPFTKIINKRGEVVASWENSASFSKFDKHVQQALKDE